MAAGNGKRCPFPFPLPARLFSRNRRFAGKVAKRVKVVTAAEAVAQIKDNDTIWLGGSGGGQAVAQKLIDALEQRFLDSSHP